MMLEMTNDELASAIDQALRNYRLVGENDQSKTMLYVHLTGLVQEQSGRAERRMVVPGLVTHGAGGKLTRDDLARAMRPAEEDGGDGKYGEAEKKERAVRRLATAGREGMGGTPDAAA